MSNKIDFKDLGISEKLLDDKKEQTTYKTQYVKQYVYNWLCVVCNEPRFVEINFIDCMCNAGVYSDGDPCTSILVLDLFIYHAKKYNSKMFNLLLNDKDKQKVLALQKIVDDRYPDIFHINNLSIFYDNKDVNDYLKEQTYNKLFKKSAATVLYVDPYDFGTVKISNITSFTKYNYCELLFNIITSDFVRNGIDDRIRNCIDCTNVKNKYDLIEKISAELKTTKVNYSFSYQFKNQNNTEIYQIFYATPHILGLVKLKEALWEVFDGKQFHQNSRYIENEQLSFLTDSDNENMCLSSYSAIAKDLLIKTFKNKTIDYNQIEMLLLEKTMLREGQILKNVLIPLINEGLIIKKGNVRNTNFKQDYYEIKGD